MSKNFFPLSPGNNSEGLEKSLSERIEEELQQVLFQIRLEEKKYRLKCQIDEWNRNHFYSKFWKRNPFQVELDNLIKSGNPDTSTSDDDSNFSSINTACRSHLEQAKSTKLEVIKARKEKREELEALEKNLGLDNISQVIQSEKSPERKNYWERLYLYAKYPGLLRKPISPTPTTTSTMNQAPQEEPVSSRKNFQDSIRMNIGSIYNITDESNSQASSKEFLSKIKKKIPSYWNIIPSWLSSEQKTVKLLLEAADKPDLNEQEMIAVERRLKRLSQYRKENLSDAEFTNAQKKIENIRTDFGAMRHLKKIEKLVLGEQAERNTDVEAEERIKTLEGYNETIEYCSTEENSQIHPANLPKTVRELQALVYFIFQYNIKEKSGDNVQVYYPLELTPAGLVTSDNGVPVPVFFPISWTAEQGLKLILTEGHPYAGLLEVLNEAFLKSSSPEVYFSVLMISIALFLSLNPEESNSLKTLLESSLIGGEGWARKLNTFKSCPKHQDLKFSWLLEYFPGSLVAPAPNTENVKTAFESMGMFTHEEICTVIAERQLSQESFTVSVGRGLGFWKSGAYSQVQRSELTQNPSVTVQSDIKPSPPEKRGLFSFFTGSKTSDDKPQQSPKTHHNDTQSEVFAFSGT